MVGPLDGERLDQVARNQGVLVDREREPEHHGCERSVAEPKQHVGRYVFRDRGAVFGRLDLGHGRGLDEVEIPEQADPEDAGHDVQPAPEEGPPRPIEPDESSAHQTGQKYDRDQQNDTRAERLMERLKKGRHDNPP